MKRLHGLLLRGLPGPFLAALGTLVFLLIMQFLFTNLARLVGRGLPPGVIVELVAYSLAYILSLAVPMSALLAVLLVFGRLSESQAYAVAKASGIPLLRLAWPVLVVGLGLVGAMTHFNNVLLPEANHRMRALWQDIRAARPGFELEPGVFFDGLRGYAIRVEDTDPEHGRLRGVLIYDYTGGGREATLVAEEADLRALPDGLTVELTLEGGELHRLSSAIGVTGQEDRYERLAFGRHRMTIDVSELGFERRDAEATTRTDRTMRTGQMVQLVDSLRAVGATRRQALRTRLDALLTPPTAAFPEAVEPLRPVGLSAETPPPAPARTRVPVVLAGEPLERQAAAYDLAVQNARAARAEVDVLLSQLQWDDRRITRYRIEIHKKYAMAVACLVFVIVAVPLGLAVRRRGYGWALAGAAGVFLFFWTLLVQGEKLADRGFFDPVVGMWSANVIGGLAAILLFWAEQRDPVGLTWRRHRARAAAPPPSPARNGRAEEHRHAPLLDT